MSSKALRTDVPFPVLVPTLQISFYKRLLTAQETHLLPALLAHLATVNIVALDEELHEFVGGASLQRLAAEGLRGELLFPVPAILSTRPALIAYYRLLLGFSQKEFYKPPLSLFQRMESSNQLVDRAIALLPELCRSMIASAEILLNGVSSLSTDLLNALTLLTLGGQLRGSYNTLLGQEATKSVFQIIRQVVQDAIREETGSHMLIRNAAGRLVRIEFAPDPDIAIREELGSARYNNRIAIEIKGGTDFSNLHNRLGEAEKSHQNAKHQGFTQFWTIVNVSRLNLVDAHNETPTTTRFFLAKSILDTTSAEHEEFRLLLRSELGLVGD